jgi:hypothetical protein
MASRGGNHQTKMPKRMREKENQDGKAKNSLKNQSEL